MMTLEQRARHAADAIEAGVSTYEPHAAIADVERRRARRRAAGAAVGAMAVFAALVAGTWMAGTSADETADPPPATTPIEPPAPITPADPTPDGDIVSESPRDETPVPENSPEPVPESPEPDRGVIALPPTSQAPATTLPPDPTTTVVLDTAPPPLAVTFPEDGQTLDRKTVRFTGTTEPGATVTAGRFEADVDDEGQWSLVLVLSEGGNRARFRAVDAAGNETTVSLTVYYEEPKEEPPPPTVEFTAHSTYGSCNFDPPYDVYHGTAEPGSKVTITSEYGGGQVYANDSGNWELKVYFPEAPPEVPFLVTVKDQAGNSKKFEFVSLVGA